MAFVSREKQLIFVHLHKCGGTSIELALDEHMAWDDLLLGSSKYGERLQGLYQAKFGLYKHSSASEIRRVVGEELWNRCFTFSIVRHPIDRMVSFYEYLKTFYLGGYRGSAVKLMYYLDQLHLVPEALTKLPKLQDAFRWPGVTACLRSSSVSDFIHSEDCWKAYGTQSQFHQLADEKGETLIVDYVSRLEDLNENWGFICQKVGVEMPLPHANKSKRKYRDWRKYFSLDDINYLGERYKADIAKFDYSL
ncbi:MAG: sulfotransferase family 2 domain-containing protein [Cyanobacteria bacterium J06623_4]